MDHTYIVDFFDADNKYCYEIKPTTELDDGLVRLKTEAAKIYCKEHGLGFAFVHEYDILDLLETKSKLDPMLCKLKTDLLRQQKRQKYAQLRQSGGGEP